MANTLTSSLVVKLIDKVTGPARNVANALNGINAAATGNGVGSGLKSALARNNAALDATRGKIVDAVAGFYALRTAIGGVINPTVELEEKMADLRKVANVDDSGMKSLEDAIKRVSAATGKSQAEVADVMANAAQAGIANEDLENYATLVLQVATAWDTNGAAAAEALAKTQTAMGWTIEQTKTFADEINILSDSTAASTSEILDFSRRTLAAGKTAGFTAEQTLAVGASMISAGATSDVAATSFTNMARALTKGASATNRQKAAMKSLGLDNRKVAKAMQQDALGTLTKVLQKVKQLPREQQTAIMSGLFGDEARALGPLLDTLDTLGQNYDAVKDKAKTAGSVQREFEQRSKTTKNAVERLGVALQNIAISIGSALTPALADLATRLQPIAAKIADFVGRFPELTRAIVGATAGLVGFRIAATSLTYLGLLGRGGALSMMSVAFNTVGRAAIGATTAIRSAVGLQVALGAMSGASLTGLQTVGVAIRAMVLAVPGVSAIAGALTGVGVALAAISAPVWVGIAAGVTAVAAAGFALYKWFDRISAVVSGFAGRIGQELKPALDLIAPAFAPISAAMGAMGQAMGSGFDYAMQKIRDFGTWLGSFFQREVLSESQKAGFEKAGADVADRMINGIKNAFAGLMDWFAGLGMRIVQAIGKIDLSSIIQWPSLPSWMGGSGDGTVAKAPNRAEAVTGHRAGGGPVWGNSSFLVGEKGPEVFTPRGAGTITSNGRSGSQIVVNFGGVTITGDGEKSAMDLVRLVERKLHEGLRGLHADIGAR